jgi:hypothetical protein
VHSPLRQENAAWNEPATKRQHPLPFVGGMTRSNSVRSYGTIPMQKGVAQYRQGSQAERKVEGTCPWKRASFLGAIVITLSMMSVGVALKPNIVRAPSWHRAVATIAGCWPNCRRASSAKLSDDCSAGADGGGDSVCKLRTDGRTRCSPFTQRCVSPYVLQEEDEGDLKVGNMQRRRMSVTSCATDKNACAVNSETTGRTECWQDNCITPYENETNCAGSRSDVCARNHNGKTQCWQDVCTEPYTDVKDCSNDGDCSKNRNGKLECWTNECIIPYVNATSCTPNSGTSDVCRANHNGLTECHDAGKGTNSTGAALCQAPYTNISDCFSDKTACDKNVNGRVSCYESTCNLPNANDCSSDSSACDNNRNGRTRCVAGTCAVPYVNKTTCTEDPHRCINNTDKKTVCDATTKKCRENVDDCSSDATLCYPNVNGKQLCRDNRCGPNVSNCADGGDAACSENRNRRTECVNGVCQVPNSTDCSEDADRCKENRNGKGMCVSPTLNTTCCSSTPMCLFSSNSFE